MEHNTMKTAFVISALLRPAIVSAYSEARAAQIERACNGALNDKDNVKAEAGKAKWNGQLNGGQSVSTKGKFSAKEVSWKETEETKYVVEKTTAPLEFVKFNGALDSLYRKAGNGPSGDLTIAVVPSYCRDWFNEMEAKASGVERANKQLAKANRQNKPKTPVSPEVPANVPESNGQPA